MVCLMRLCKDRYKLTSCRHNRVLVTFQNLIDVLGGVAQQGAGSRGAESQMAQLLFNTGLGQDRAGYTSQAENAQAQALAALQQAMFQSRFGVEGDRNNLANQLAQSIINRRRWRY
jgi:hypothetical protein